MGTSARGRPEGKPARDIVLALLRPARAADGRDLPQRPATQLTSGYHMMFAARYHAGKWLMYLGWRVLPPRTRAGVSLLVALGKDVVEANAGVVGVPAAGRQLRKRVVTTGNKHGRR